MTILKAWFSKKDSNRALLSAMTAVAENDNADTRKELYDRLLKAVLLVPVPESGTEPGVKRYSKGDPLDLELLKSEDGGTLLLVFTDEQGLLAWEPKGSRCVAIEGSDLFRLAKDNMADTVIINVAGPISGGQLRRFEIEALSEGKHPDLSPVKGENITVAEGTKLKVSFPQTPPPMEVLEAMLEALEQVPVVKAAYLFEISIEDQEPELTLGLCVEEDATEEDAQEAVHSIGDTAGPKFSEPVNLMVVNNDWLPRIEEAIPLFYDRDAEE